jgi:hypothetical protein
MELLDQFNEKIESLLNECSPEVTPTVCNFISTKEGKDKLFILIQKKVIQERLTIGEAIIEIEREFNVNSYTE